MYARPINHELKMMPRIVAATGGMLSNWLVGRPTKPNPVTTPGNIPASKRLHHDSRVSIRAVGDTPVTYPTRKRQASNWPPVLTAPLQAVAMPQRKKMRNCQTWGVKYFSTMLLGSSKIMYEIWQTSALAWPTTVCLPCTTYPVDRCHPVVRV